MKAYSTFIILKYRTMENINAKITVKYTDLSNNKAHTVFGTGSISPFNEISKEEMGSIIANDIAKNHAGHSNFKIHWFEAVEI